MNERSAPARPRPVAEAPVAALAADAAGLAKEWLIALIASGPLAAAQRLPVDDLVRQAPVLCDEIARALASDLELERLSSRGDLAPLARRAGAMAGAAAPEDCVAAVEILRVIIWRRVLGELRDPEAGLVGELASRLAHVCSVVAAASVVTAPRRGTAEAAARVTPPPPVQPRQTPEPSSPTAARYPAAERAAEGSPSPSAASVPMRPPLAPTASSLPSRSVSAQPLNVGPPAVGASPGDGAVNGEGPTSWIGSIGHRLERFKQDGLPFAVLLIEVSDIDRLRQAEGEREVAHLVGQVERAVSGELRPADLLTRESVGRYWLVTPETDGEGALTLAGRLAAAVEAGASHRGVPLRVAMGVAICPQDGREPAALAARADIGLYTARSSGRAVMAVQDLP